MYRKFHRRLNALSLLGASDILGHGKKGLEKESLRVTPSGGIAQTPHPVALGSALTHPYITTDYSEALIELITPPFERNVDTLSFLRRTHQFVYSHLGDELLWGMSMPCAVAGDESVPIAEYGSSNSGMMRHIYRRGLAHRYGRVMQVISGVHYNYSAPLNFWPMFQEMEGDRGDLSAFTSDRYFGLIRNVLRYGWLLIYLFGASPALCRSFLGERADRFRTFDETTRYEPYATSLRMSDIGYTNSSQASLNVAYDGLDAYVTSLTRAIETPYEEFEAIGVQVDGEYRQLNANILQIENEFYSSVRPKQIAERGEKPTVALHRRGVAYVEVRSLDVNPFSDIGIDAEQLAVLEAFMLFCLFQESPPISPDEHHAIDENVAQTAYRGREPGLKLQRTGSVVALRDWGLEVVDKMANIATHLTGTGASVSESLDVMRRRLTDPEMTPSALILREMREDSVGFFHYAMRLSGSQRDTLRGEAISPEIGRAYDTWGLESLAEQKTLESSDEVSFENYLAQYFLPVA